jgi:hypothetical protein
VQAREYQQVTPTPSRIRELISYATHIRRDFERLTPEKFAAHEAVATTLNATIQALKGLEIPQRYRAEIIVREAEIGACEDTIRRWLKARGQSYLLNRIEPKPLPPVPGVVTATLVCPDGKRIDLGEGVMCDFETHAEEGTAAHEQGERVYGRGNVVLRVIDGGKKS